VIALLLAGVTTLAVQDRLTRRRPPALDLAD
jgi:hypothetical protein